MDLEIHDLCYVCCISTYVVNRIIPSSPVKNSSGLKSLWKSSLRRNGGRGREFWEEWRTDTRTSVKGDDSDETVTLRLHSLNNCEAPHYASVLSRTEVGKIPKFIPIPY